MLTAWTPCQMSVNPRVLLIHRSIPVKRRKVHHPSPKRLFVERVYYIDLSFVLFGSIFSFSLYSTGLSLQRCGYGSSRFLSQILKFIWGVSNSIHPRCWRPPPCAVRTKWFTYPL